LSDVDAAAESVRQGQAAAEYAKLRFQAEQKKYDRGVTQLFFLLDAQTQFNQAESDLLQQQILYRRAIVSLYLATGDLLAELGIAVQ
jgi:outer membrane protein TolC